MSCITLLLARMAPSYTAHACSLDVQLKVNHAALIISASLNVWVVHVSVWYAAEVGVATGRAPDEVKVDWMMVGSHGRRTKSGTKRGGQLMVAVLH